MNFSSRVSALLVWISSSRGDDVKQRVPSLELRTTLNLTHGRHLPLASKIGWRYCPSPLSLSCCSLLTALLTSNVKQNEDWQHKFTRRIVRLIALLAHSLLRLQCAAMKKVTHYHILSGIHNTCFTIFESEMVGRF